jgi:D-3-phosphoglycerate dehydrogenase
MKIFFDFDSTFIQTETLDQLAFLQGVTAVEEITHQAMEGKLNFHEALVKRLSLLTINAHECSRLIAHLPVSVSIQRHSGWFIQNNQNIYIISGGFKEIIVPIVAPYGISADQVFANNFIDGKLNMNNPLAYADGKTSVIASLTHIDQEFSVMVGDGYTDLQVKRDGAVTRFYAYVENVYRDAIVAEADRTIHSIEDLLESRPF